MSSFSVFQLVAMLFVHLSATWVESFLPWPIRLANGYQQPTWGKSRNFLYIVDHGNNMASAAASGESKSPLRQQVQDKGEIVVHSVTTLDDYKTVLLGDDTERIVVVRFHAPYCKACQAIRVAYDRLVKQSNPEFVKFVDVAITEQNGLGEQLGIPGVPFGQIHVPQMGLVEELFISRRHMAKFRKVLGWYVDEKCDIPDEFFDNPHQMDDNENLIL
jgi:thiol-disulfide isomerase/thioredoxin